MTARELANLMDKQATLIVPMSGWTAEVPVKIVDARDAYGRQDLMVEIVGGKGQGWVNAERVRVKP